MKFFRKSALLVLGLIMSSISAGICSSEVVLNTSDGLRLAVDSATGAAAGLSINGKSCKVESKPLVSIETVDIKDPGPNMLPDTVSTEDLSNWKITGEMTFDGNAGRDNGPCLRLDRKSMEAPWTEVKRNVEINQDRAEPILISAWSKAKLSSDSRLTGIVNADVAIGAILIYADGTREQRCQSAYIPQYNHDWTRVQTALCPDKPVKTIELSIFLRGSKAGSLWIDELEVRQARYITESVTAPLVQAGNMWRQEAVLKDAGVRVWLTYRPKGSHIEVHGDIQSIDKEDKAVTARIAIPIDARGGKWWHHNRGSETINDHIYYDSFWYAAGRTGQHSMYPWSCVDLPNGCSLSLGVDIGEPQISRLLYDGYSKRYSAEFDIGLTQDGPRGGHGSFTAILYKSDPAWPFRAAADRYHSIYPWAFEKRLKNEGTWNPFFATQDAPDWKDFGIQFNESVQDFAWESKQGITTFYYIEPGCAHTDMYLYDKDEVSPHVALQRIRELLDGKRGLKPEWDPTDPWVRDAAAGILAGYQEDAWGYPAALGMGADEMFFLNSAPGIAPARGYGYNSADVEMMCANEALSLKGKYHLDNWDPAAYDSVRSYWIENDNAHSGKQCIKVTTEPHYSHWSPWARGVKQIVTLPEPYKDSIEIEFWARGDNVSDGKLNANALLRWEDGRQQSCAVTADRITGEWRRYHAVFKPEQPVRHFQFFVRLDRSGEDVWVDDVRFGPEGTTDNWLANAGFEKGSWIDAEISGIYLDTLESTQGFLNHRREHFPYLKTNLSFSWERRVVQPHIFGAWEFAKNISDSLHRDGKLLMANACPLWTPFCVPWVDVAGQEEDWVPGGTGWNPKSDASFNWCRSMSGTKPYCLLLQSRGDVEKVRKQLARCTFYGVFPSFGTLASGSETKLSEVYYWNKDALEQDRPLWKKYIPALKTIAKAGWKPVTYAKCSNPDIWLERYGSPSTGNWYIAAFAQKGTSQTGIITIDRKALGLNGKISIKSVLGDFKPVVLQPGQSKLEIRVPTEDTVVVSLSKA